MDALELARKFAYSQGFHMGVRWFDQEDLVQELAMRALETKDIAETDAYTWSAMRSRWIDLRRFFSRRKDQLIDDIVIKDKPSVDFDIIKELDILPNLYVKVIILYYFHSYTMKEIADQLGVSEKSVSRYHQYAISILKRRFSSYDC